MTQPSYTTNLSTLDQAESNTSWVEFTGLSYNAHGSPQGADADWPFIQNTYAVTQTCSASKGGIGSLGFDNGSAIGGHGTDGAYLVWQLFANSNYEAYADGGLRVVIGDSVSSFYSWDVGGNDVGVALYLGWQNHAVNVTVSPDDSTGTYAGSNEQIVGAAVNTGSVSIGKGEPHAVDVIRYGRCDAVFEYGDGTSGYCTLEEFAKANDANDISFTADTTNADATLTNISPDTEKLYPGAPVSGTGIPASTYIKSITNSTTAEMTNNATATNTTVSITSQPYNVWGLIQKVPGGYLWKGLMQFGTASNAVDFRDSDRIIFIQWCPKVTSNFNTIEIVNASSRIDMTNFQFVQLDTSTASDGRWITTNDADVNLENCSFQDMGTFTFDSNTVALSCRFIRCLQIDPGGGDLSFSSILESAVTGGGSAGGGALLWNDSADPNTYLNDMTFTKGAGSHHAIEFGTSAPTTINFTNMTFTDFSASDQQTTSVLYFPDTGSNVTWTVNHSGTTGTISYYKARSGDTVNVTASVPVTITVKDTDGNLLEGIQTAVYKTSDRTQIMNVDTNASGVASENYTGSTPVEVEVRCRKSSAKGKKYKHYSSKQNVTGDGLTLSVTMVIDPNVNLTTTTSTTTTTTV